MDDMFTAMAENSMIQMAMWRPSWTSFSFPNGIVGSSIIFVMRKYNNKYGSATLHDLDYNVMYTRSVTASGWTNWIGNATEIRHVIATMVIGADGVINSTISMFATTDTTYPTLSVQALFEGYPVAILGARCKNNGDISIYTDKPGQTHKFMIIAVSNAFIPK